MSMVTLLPFPLNICIDLHEPIHPSNYSVPNDICADDIFKAASSLGQSVKAIRLQYAKNKTFTPHVLEEFLQTCFKCECLDFSHCYDLQDSDLKVIAESCDKNRSASIRRIMLCSIPKITEAGLAYFRRLTSLDELDAERCLKIDNLVSQPGHFVIKYGNWTGYEGY